MRTFRIAFLLTLATLNHVLHADPIPVSAQALSELLSPQQYSAPASVKPLNRPQLAAEVTGRIKAIPVQVGDVVKPDDVLVELDCRMHEARLQSARAALQQARTQRGFAQAQLKRAQNLKRKGGISSEVLDQRETELNNARADVQAKTSQRELAALDMQHCRIQAPFGALVSQRLASVGSLANPGTPLLELVQLDQTEVSVDLREHEADALRSARQISFRYQEKDYPVNLRTLFPLVDERTRAREARLIFNETSAPVGAAGRLIWQGADHLLPAQYLVRRGSQLGVFVARENKAVFVVVPKAREGQAAYVDLPSETWLITQGRQRLQDGDEITLSD